MKMIFFTSLFMMRIAAADAQHAEKIVLGTDKQWYYPGEPLWFTLNVFDACADTLSSLSKIAYVELIGADNKPVHQMKVAITDAHGDGSFTIAENITTGIYSVVAYTNWMKNFGAGSFARQSVQVVNPLKIAPLNVVHKEVINPPANVAGMQVVPSKNEYAKRERVSVRIAGAASSRVSVSVFRTDALQRGTAEIVDEQPENPCNIGRQEVYSFIPEARGHIITGRVIDKRTQQPKAGIRGYLSVIHAPNHLFVATSDSGGIIRFEVGDLAGEKELVLQTNPGIDSSYAIELVTPYAGEGAHLSGSPEQNVFEASPAVVNAGIVSAQVQRYFNPGAKLIDDSISGSEIPFYGKPDAVYLMSDYVHFSTVEEILREYVTTVGVQRRNGRLFPVVYNFLANRVPFSGAPLILVNGVPMFDHSRFMELNTDEFYSIAVVARKYFMGHQTFYGIVDVRLNTDLKNFGRYATVVDYDGASVADQFYSPKYEDEPKRNNRIPDFRNVLYWNPRLDKDKNGNYAFDFYSSDLEGEYAIVVRAVADNGKVETSQTSIQVK